MNVVKEINKINQRELDLGISGSWHDDYKDSAYIFAGGLHPELTEGDVITIFSQYGEVMDVNMPRDKNTGKTKGFAFLMYEDQRSTVLAVDNLNGARVLERTLRVDHVKDYKQPRTKNEEGEWVDREDQSLNAKPEVVVDAGAESESSESDGPDIDPDDPMRDYLLAKYKEEKAKKKGSSKGKHKRKDETPEERRARKERKKQKKLKKAEKSEGMRAVEDLLKELEREHRPKRRSPSPDGRRRPDSRDRRAERDEDRPRDRRRSRDRGGSPPRSPRDGPSRHRSPPRSPGRDSRYRSSRHDEPPHRRPREGDAPPRRRHADDERTPPRKRARDEDMDITPPRRRDRD
ncbi:RNA-binding domain-containing protein [Phanerochaete sordida]|uniref:RNA-binding domain-containing protein n=1 Tax=Phanerochaete sordida TaxID=48140 RepID=A0A9P3FXC4_9APHY|nr:RNA-binding domain-containing protein [Phanerochaete sordida]